MYTYIYKNRVVNTVIMLLLMFSSFSATKAQNHIINSAGRFDGQETSVSQMSQLAEELFLYNAGLKNSLQNNRGKISSVLLPLIDDIYLPPAAVLASYVETLESLKQFTPFGDGINIKQKINEGTVLVYVSYSSDDVISVIERLAEDVININSKFKLAVIHIKVKNLELLASVNTIKKIQPVMQPNLSNGSVVTEGDTVHETSTVRDLYNDNGSGIKVGVISNGVDSRVSSQATGDLPLDGAGLTV